MVGNEANDPLTGNDVKDTVLDFFIAGNIPFNQADSPEFQRLISMIKVKGKAVKINRKNLRSRLAEPAAIAKKDLMDELAANVSRVSLAMDGWTSRLNNVQRGLIESNRIFARFDSVKHCKNQSNIESNRTIAR